MANATVNTSNLLELVLADGNASLYPQVVIYNVNSVAVATVNLSSISGGYYTGSWVPVVAGEYFAVYTAYSDPGRTVLFAKASDKIRAFADGAIPAVTPNSAVILALVMADGNASLHPQAQVYDNSNSVLTTVTLTNMSGGFYSSNWTPTQVGDYVVVYSVYSDIGHTVLFTKTEERIQVYAAGSVAGTSVSSVIMIPPININPTAAPEPQPFKPLPPIVVSR